MHCGSLSRHVSKAENRVARQHHGREVKDEFTRALTASRIGRTVHRLLEYTMRRTNQLLTRHMLLNKVWGYKCIPRTNLVDVHTSHLR